MKTLEQILKYKSLAFDGRDSLRLVNFIPVELWTKLNLTPEEGIDPKTIKIKPLTKENILIHLTADLDFAFEKALNKRGISASCMYEVIKMWMWVLDDELADSNYDNYPQYGLPLFAAVARKYNLPCPIGNDIGNELRYDSRYS